MLKNKVLVREEGIPTQDPDYYPWDEESESAKRFKMDLTDIFYLEAGNTLFRGSVAFGLEDVPQSEDA